jgi:hypothetical protein
VWSNHCKKYNINYNEIILFNNQKHLKPLVTPKLIKDKIKKITFSFESLHEIPYILGARDGNHIPIIAPKVNPKSYNCQKRFYSTLIQGIVDTKCSFWD